MKDDNKPRHDDQLVRVPRVVLEDRILGAWVGKSYGADGQARQNVLAGIPAELAGHPAYNPHADDIDFQIECDYIGMISPGLPEAAQDLCRVTGRSNPASEGVGITLGRVVSYAGRVAELPRRFWPIPSHHQESVSDRH